MAKRGRPAIRQTAHSVAEEARLDQFEFEIPGFAFRWVNPLRRARSGWGIWSPVTRDSELGQQVAEKLNNVVDKFNGLNADANLFYRGSDTILAYASQDAAEAHRDRLDDIAEQRIRSVDAAKLQRNVVIPGVGNYAYPQPEE